ncbi:MAG TPA: apolipoprotein N-acyltransferase [Burkholderiales bacterium]|nr:apolipoprotein N-acyltransferase [Burkholderiales bacterium]
MSSVLAVVKPADSPLALLAALALGAVSVLGFAPFYLYPVSPLALAAAVTLWLYAPSARAAVKSGFVFGLGLFLGGVSWIYVSLHDYGGMAMPLAAVVVLGFCAVLALFPALVAGLLRQAGGSDAVKLLLLLPALWTLAEWVRGWLFTGFPWLAVGYSQAPGSPLAGYAPLFGVYGVGLATATVAGCCALAGLHQLEPAAAGWARRLGRFVLGVPLWIAVAILAGGLAASAPAWTQPADDGPTSVALIQGNIPQELKWRPERARDTLLSYLELVRATDAKLILLPETALPMFNVDLPAGYLDALADHARRNGGDLLTGVPEYAGPGRYFNSVLSTGITPSQTYRKVHLVPFGDYFPMSGMLGWAMKLLDIPMSDFSRGDPDQPPIRAAGQRIAANICYEDVFGEELIRRLPEATLLANFTNDAWWGRSLASRQHLQMSQMRTLETGRYMLRTTNTGVTAIIDTRGRVVEAAPEFETAVVSGEVRGYLGATPYVRWGNAAFVVLAAVMAVGGLLLGRRRAGE